MPDDVHRANNSKARAEASNIQLAVLDQGLPTFSIKVCQVVNILGCVGHTGSVVNTQPCHHSMKATTDNAHINGCGCVPQNFVCKIRHGRLDLGHGHSLPTPDP